MKDKAFIITDTNKIEYENWCRDNNLPAYSTDSRKKFFSLILQDKLIKDKNHKHLVVVEE